MSALGDNKKTLLHSAAYLGITAALYYPVVSNVRRVVNGSLDDSYTIMWLLWWVKRSVLGTGSGLSYSSFVESPFGVDVTHSTFINHLLALPAAWWLGVVGAFNVMILASFFLSALGMYLLVMEVTGCRAGAFFAGLAFSFSPFHTAFSATGGMDASQMQYMPFALLFLVRYDKGGASKDLILFMVFVLLSVFSFGYYGAIIFAAAGVYYLRTRIVPQAFRLIGSHKEPGLRDMLVWAPISFLFFVFAYESFDLVTPFIKTLVWVVPVAGAISVAAGKEGRKSEFFRRLGEVFTATGPRERYLALGGAAVLFALVAVFLFPVFSPATREISSSYFVPAYSYLVPTPDHPLLGGFVSARFIPQKDPVVGKMVRVGFVLFALIAFAAVNTLRGAKKDPVREAFLLVFLTGAALALPPEIRFGEFTFRGPVYFFHALVPPFVDIRRVVVLMLLGGCVLAGLGVKELLKLTGRRPVKLAVYSSLLVLLAIEFYPATVFKDTSKVPAAYEWLKNKPGDYTVAEYPLTSIYDSKRNEPFFGQTVHGRRLLNPFGAVGHDPAPSNKALKPYIDRGGPANELYSNTENAAAALSRLGVKYVVLRTDKFGTGVVLETGGWLKEEAKLPGSVIYSVTAQPATAFLSFKDFYRDGFFLNYSEKTEKGYEIRNPYYRPEESVYNGKAWLWMGKNASVTLTGLKISGAVYDLTFIARSGPVPALITVKDRGSEIYRATVSAEPATYTIKGIKLDALEVKTLEFEIENDGALRAARGFIDPRSKDEPVSYIGIALRDAAVKEEAAGEKPAGLIGSGLVDGIYGEGGL